MVRRSCTERICHMPPDACLGCRKRRMIGVDASWSRRAGAACCRSTLRPCAQKCRDILDKSAKLSLLRRHVLSEVHLLCRQLLRVRALRLLSGVDAVYERVDLALQAVDPVFQQRHRVGVPASGVHQAVVGLVQLLLQRKRVRRLPVDRRRDQWLHLPQLAEVARRCCCCRRRRGGHAGVSRRGVRRLSRHGERETAGVRSCFSFVYVCAADACQRSIAGSRVDKRDRRDRVQTRFADER